MENAQQFALSYPEENRGEAYRCLGTKAVLDILSSSHRGIILEEWLAEVSPPYLSDVIYGVVRAAQNISEESFQPVKRVVRRNYPSDFYLHWGYRHVGYGY